MFGGGENMNAVKHRLINMPIGLGIALANNKLASKYFYSLPESAQKLRIIAHTHTIYNKEEMLSFINSLVVSCNTIRHIND
jgi:hypothetical protein